MRWQQVTNFDFKEPYIAGETIHEVLLQTVSVVEILDSGRAKVELELWERETRFPFDLPYSAFIFVWQIVTGRPFMLFGI